ncbi:hypothetical protein C0Z11_08075 [Acidipropionibacterium jensenii]|nr:hypothetical protein C0Z11_08075 [Acidipropionibacterium jensenii]
MQFRPRRLRPTFAWVIAQPDVGAATEEAPADWETADGLELPDAGLEPAAGPGADPVQPDAIRHNPTISAAPLAQGRPRSAPSPPPTST